MVQKDLVKCSLVRNQKNACPHPDLIVFPSSGSLLTDKQLKAGENILCWSYEIGRIWKCM